MSRFPPHGLAPGLKRDDRIDAEESLSARSRELPSKRNLLIASLGQEAVIIDLPALTANRLRVYYVGRFDQATQVSEARLTITTLSAGQNVRAALYFYDTVAPKRRLVKISDTEAVFDATTTGLKTASLRDDVIVNPGEIFIGVKPSDNTLGVAGVDTLTVSRTVPTYFITASAGVMPASVEFAALSKGYTGRVLSVAYLNHDAAQFM